jgi:squalene-hopene/tetraprenyl-beta-curcumene cyclase
MSNSSEAFSLDMELAAVDAVIADLQRRWPNAIALEPERKSSYYALPYRLREAFPSLAPRAIRPLAVFCKLYAGSILLHDQVIDGQPVDGADRSSPATPSLRIVAMHAEAYHQLHAAIPARAAFWDRLRDYLAAYADACVEEQGFAPGGRSWREYTEPVALRIVIGKNGPARIIAAGLAELAGDERLLDPLLEVTNAFNVATQMWDDLEDWKDDLRRGIPSLLLARVVSGRPVGLDAAAWRDLLQQLTRELYYRGHVGHVLDLALTSLDTAEQLESVVPDLGLHALTGKLRRRCEALRSDIDRIVRANLQRARDQPRVALNLTDARAPWQDVAWSALRFLEAQWNLGFGEARDLMQYPAELRFGPADTCYFGDVFQRALLTDALCDADPVLGGQLGPVIEREARYLVDQRLRTTTGGWRYFANLPELPPDADDLAQVMQALLRVGWRDEVVRHGEAPLAVLLRDNSHDDGSFETWIVPAAERTELEERHAALVESVWGTGVDCDVVPNLLYALQLYDPARFAEVIRNGAAYLEDQQRDDGTWTSRWYAGPYYAIYVCLRLFDAVQPTSRCVARALRFLRETQRSDGGWGLHGEASDPLSTALALLGLSMGQRGCGDRADRHRMARGMAALGSALESDGAWPAQKLIFKGLRTFHGSRTLTTTFALKAAVACGRLGDASIAAAS